jgi:hypothetical protein
MPQQLCDDCEVVKKDTADVNEILSSQLGRYASMEGEVAAGKSMGWLK